MEDVEPPSARALSGMCVDLCGLRPLASASDLPVSDWVVVRVRAAALGLPDVTMARGSYPVEIARPYTAGLEAAGIVEEASPSMAEWLGRRVVTFTPQPFGSLAPLAVGLRDAMFEVPEGLSDEEAAAFLLASHTSYHALVRRGGLRAGETALILGAAGGLGSAAIQLARAVGARVLAVAGGAEKADFCRRLGAETVIDHLREDVVERARALTAGAGVDLVFDPVQGEPGERARQALAPEGRHVLCGHAGGLRPIDPCSFYMQNLTLVGATMGAYPPPLGRQIEEDAHRAILELCRAGRYRPAVGAVVAFAEVPGALEDLAARRTLGRTVVRIG
jgi:NADPH2:quinone reductase